VCVPERSSPPMIKTHHVVLVALVALSACSGRSTNAQGLPQPDRQVPPNAAVMKMSFAPIVQRAAPAVVNVYSRRVVRTQVDPFWGMFMNGGVPQQRVAQSLGSGSI